MSNRKAILLILAGFVYFLAGYVGILLLLVGFSHWLLGFSAANGVAVLSGKYLAWAFVGVVPISVLFYLHILLWDFWFMRPVRRRS